MCSTKFFQIIILEKYIHSPRTISLSGFNIWYYRIENFLYDAKVYKFIETS